MKKLYCDIFDKYKNIKIPKITYVFEKTFSFSIICNMCENEDEKIFKEEDSIEILTILGLFKNL